MTTDGTPIAVLANVGSVADAEAAMDNHADGSGLVRTEFLFTGRRLAPDRDEQVAVYRQIAQAFDGRPVVLRTMDVGGDKPVPFLSQASEPNPFLGVRGIRLSLRHRELLLDQLVAMCQVAKDHPVSIMVPMIATLDEVFEVCRVLDEAVAAAGGSAANPPAAAGPVRGSAARPRLGIMVEVPSVALNATVFAPHVDFFSVGTNDLTQYALAAERGNPAMAKIADGLDPGVLRLIDALCREAGDIPVSECGELAADPATVPILIGLGVRSLSVVPPAVPAVKQQVRRLSLDRARGLARRAMDCGRAADVRALR